MEKTCTCCKVKKNLESFYKDRRMKSGYRSRCKKCIIRISKNYYQENKEFRKDYYKKHKKHKKKYCQDYYKNNREELRKKENERYQKNKKSFIAKSIRWQQKVKNDPYRKFKNRIKTSMRQYIKKNGRKTFDLLGYTREEFLNRMKETLPKEFTWEDFLNNSIKFHIDHIIPQNNYKNEVEYLTKCWNLRNLRLISAKENLNRLDVIDMNLVEEYKIEDLLPFV